MLERMEVTDKQHAEYMNKMFANMERLTGLLRQIMLPQETSPQHNLISSIKVSLVPLCHLHLCVIKWTDQTLDNGAINLFNLSQIIMDQRTW